MNLKLLSAFLFFGLLLVACNKDDDDDCATSDVTYTNTIASMLNTSCAVSGCHVAGNEAVAFFSLEDYANAKGAADFGRIVGAISYEDDFSAMPPTGQLDQCDIDKITAWVEAGAPE